MVDFKEIHQGVEFDEWAYQTGLYASEQYLVENYLHPASGPTLEAGTAGGRIILALQALGFHNLYGFDYVSDFIDVAKQRDRQKNITYSTQNATDLDYADGFFDNVLYLQQVLCYINDDADRLRALQEAHRILRPGGTALFSFLILDGRLHKTLYAMFIRYIRLLRRLRNSPLSASHLPSLQINRRNNYAALLDRQPYMYWYGIDEIYQLLQQLDFEVVALGSDLQISAGHMLTTPAELIQAPLGGLLYCVCQKRS